MSVEFDEKQVSFENNTISRPKETGIDLKLVSWGIVSTRAQAHALMLVIIICAFGFTIFSIISVFKTPETKVIAPAGNSVLRPQNEPPRLAKPVY